MFAINRRDESLGMLRYHQFHQETKETVEKLPSGIYKVETVQTMFGDQVIFNQDISEDKLIPMKSGQFADIYNKLDYTLNPKCMEVHKDFGYLNKLGVLLYGPPGTGKTVFTKLMCRELIKKYNCIALEINPFHDDYNSIINSLRRDNIDLPIILIMDEVDRWLGNKETADLLVFLDGFQSKNNIITIMITNNYHKLSKGLTENRPSRIKIKEEIKKVPLEIVTEVVKSKLTEKYSKSINVAKLAYKLSEEEVTMDQIKHVLLNIACYGSSIEDAIKEVKDIPVVDTGIVY